jgi:RNA polymerase sigma-70 factor (sigma-E family)
MGGVEASRAVDARGADADVETAFDVLIRAQGQRNFRLAVLLAGDVDRGQDLLQTVHEQMYRHFRRNGVPDHPEQYLRTSLIHAASRSWRLPSRGREVLVSDPPEPDAATHDHAVLAREQLLPALRRLSQRQRTVLALRYFADLSEAATAELMGCTTGTVKTLTHRALKRLRTDTTLRELGSPSGVLR